VVRPNLVRHHGGRRRLKRAVGTAKNTSKAEAEKVLEQLNDLLKLADDLPTRARIGDFIRHATRRTGPLPQVRDVRRRLGLTGDLAGTETTGELLEAWFTSRRPGWRASTVKSYREKLDQHILPVIKDVPAERLNEIHIAVVFTRIEERNAEIVTAREAGEKVSARVVGISTQHHILGVVRAALNWGVRQRKIRFNPALGLDLAPRTREPVVVYDAEQVRVFLEHAEAVHDRLALLYRLVLLRGMRRGEAVGLRWSGLDLDAGIARIARPILQLGGKITEGRPKTKAGERVVSLDRATVAALKAHRSRQNSERLAWGKAYQDDDLVFAREDGTPIRPDYVTEHFKRLAGDAGLPVIRLHDGRHTAASLGLLAGLDIKIVQDQLGHSTSAFTRDLYTHVVPALRDDAAERVAALVELPIRHAKDTGA